MNYRSKNCSLALHSHYVIGAWIFVSIRFSQRLLLLDEQPENSAVPGRLLHNRAGTEARSCQFGDACCRPSGGPQEARVPKANRQLSSDLSGDKIGYAPGWV